MAPYGPEPETPGARRQTTVAALVMVAALAVPYSSQGFQQQIAVVLQGSVLAPFIAMQERLAEGRARADQIDLLQHQLDSIVSVSATQSVLANENRELRDLLGLADRAGPRFLPAAVLRPGTPGSESMFLVNVGAEDGVRVGAPIVSARGLVGRVLEVRPRIAVGMDWTYPDFRASGMLADGSASGLVENVRGDFREEDRLMLNGTAYHATLTRGSLVVTSGLGGVFPRGIPIGRIDATAEVQGSWRKSYWLRPLVDLSTVTHVLVETAVGGDDVSDLWTSDSASLASDSTRARVQPATSPRPRPGAGGATPANVAPVSPPVRTAPPANRPPPAEAAPPDRPEAPPTGADQPRADTTPDRADATPDRADAVPLPPDSSGAPSSPTLPRPDSARALPDSVLPAADSSRARPDSSRLPSDPPLPGNR